MIICTCVCLCKCYIQYTQQHEFLIKLLHVHVYSTVPVHTDMTSLSLSHSQSLCCEDPCGVCPLLILPFAGKVEADEETEGRPWDGQDDWKLLAIWARNEKKTKIKKRDY